MGTILLAFKDFYVGVVTLIRTPGKGEIFGYKRIKTKALMAFVSLQGGNRYKGKTTQTLTNENDSAHASPVILHPYASSSTVSIMSREQ